VKRLSAARLVLTLVLFALGLALCFAIGLAMGPSDLDLRGLWSGLADPDETAVADIVWRIRLPRLLLAGLVGASLALAGVVFQALLRNPLADPFVLGVSGGAALVSVAALSFGASVGLSVEAVPLAAFVGSLAVTLLLYALAGGRGHERATQLLLTGVIFNSFASAAIVFVASAAGRAEGSQVFLFLIGNLANARVELIFAVALLFAIGLVVSTLLSRSLNLLSLGEASALQLGVPVEWHRRLLLVASSLAVGAAVSVAGLVGFVGLIVPHAVRLLVGPDHRLLVPASALAGAAFLILCDSTARSVLGGRELPVGAITALVGGPVFLWLLRREQKRAGAR